MDNRFGADAEDPLDPKRKIFNALAGSDDEPDQQIDPMPKIELPGPSAAPAAAPPPPAMDFSRLSGYNENKFNDPNKQSAKYQMARALSTFDPTKGFSGDSVAALNALGFGNFSAKDGSDKLSLSGLTDKGRGAGLVGDYTDADFIEALKSGNGKWGYADPAYEAMNPTSSGGGQGGGGSLDALLSGGDPMAKIKAAIAQLSGPRTSAQALLEALR